jgi:hypothetical protein
MRWDSPKVDRVQAPLVRPVDICCDGRKCEQQSRAACRIFHIFGPFFSHFWSFFHVWISKQRKLIFEP